MRAAVEQLELDLAKLTLNLQLVASRCGKLAVRCNGTPVAESLGELAFGLRKLSAQFDSLVGDFEDRGVLDVGGG